MKLFYVLKTNGICDLLVKILYSIAMFFCLPTKAICQSDGPWEIPVLVIRYFPLAQNGMNIDISVTSNVSETKFEIEKKCVKQTQDVIDSLENGSRFRAYLDPTAKPSLRFKIVDTLTFEEALPINPSKKDKPDYFKIMERVKIKEYVEKKNVKEVWIWAYHSKEVSPWESNMSSPFGDVSNSDRDQLDLPVLKKTYTVYHYNYQRESEMAVHNHLHQIEAIMRKHGGELWKNFEGSPGAWICGNCHFPPNGRFDYDYKNKEGVNSVIEDWKPDFKNSKRIFLNCEKWQSSGLNWYIYWMQSIPGLGNNIEYSNKEVLSNWWIFIGDYDFAIRNNFKLFKTK